MRFIKFNNGDKMPILGLGTWKSAPGEVYQAVLWALETGYRHIDCAAVYQNEKEVGKALSEAFENGLVKREEVFVTSKLWNNFHEEDQVEKGLMQSMQDLQLDYLDLYLIHWPVAVKRQVLFPEKESDFLTYKEAPLSGTWKGMESVKQKGLTKHIGVSNFNSSKLKEVMEKAQVKPELNQIESHPFLPQENLVMFCKENGIALTAYSPLGSADRPKGRKKQDEPALMENTMIKEIAQKHEVTPAQVLIAWSIQRDIAVIPKSVNKDRIKQNFEAILVKLDDTDKQQIQNIAIQYRYIDGTFFTDIPGSPYQLSDIWE
ncbi:MAG: aldo/keto reductase [Cyclobacteriaceae bacterium]